MKEIILSFLQPIVVITILVVAILILEWAVKRVKNDRIKELLEKALNILRTVTKSTTQTFVSGLKKQGAFSKECQEEAMTMSKSKALAMFGEEVVKAIEKEYGDVDTWLTENIESILHDDKKGKE